MKRIHLPVKKPAEAYRPKPTVTSNESPTTVQLKQLQQQAPVQFQQSILALQSTHGNRAVVQLLRQLETPASQEAVHHAAAKGVQGSGGRLPHHDKIQRSFGRHDISRVQAYTGKQSAAANATMGAKAYATGNKIAFAESTPDLHTAAHEAAHVIQQQSGVQLKGGVGKNGDKYEQHANRVADLVIRGQSAQAALDSMANKESAAAGSQSNVQAMLKTKVGGSMEGSEKEEDKGEKTTTPTVNKFATLVNQMDSLLDSGPVFIGESHDQDYGSDAVQALIKLGKVKKIFLEMVPLPNETFAKFFDHLTTEKDYDEVKWIYTTKMKIINFVGTTARRYSALTHYAVTNKVEVYYSDTESKKPNLPEQIQERNEYTSKYIRDHVEQPGAHTVVLGGNLHYQTQVEDPKDELVSGRLTKRIVEVDPIHHQLGYGNTSSQVNRFFDLSKKEYVE